MSESKSKANGTNPTLSLPSKLLTWSGLPTLMAALLATSPSTALNLPIVILPVFLALWQRSKLSPPQQPDFETLLWTFVASGTLGTAGIIVVQSALSYTSAFILFGSRMDEYLTEFGRSSTTSLTTDELTKRAAIARSWQHVTFLFLLAFFMAGFTEEAMKYLSVTYIRHRRAKATKLTELEYIAYILASSLGFSTLESIGFIYTSATSDPTAMLAPTVLERVLIGITGHALMGVLTALNMIRRDFRGEELGLWKVLAPAVLWHGCFDFALFSISATDGNVGWIHPTELGSLLLLFGVAVGMLVALGLHVRSSLRRLDLKM